MVARALYLKYRPMDFDEIVGQEPITRTLRNALRQGRIRHAYLFAGPRGTGKTTMARVLAKAVNCLAPEDQRPCNACSICTQINEGRFLDLIEIDAASNRGIDEMRDIRDKVNFRPSQGRYKVYVLDEAHMLTEPAFNALLKTLEEPPPHALFALVTTEPHKIPPTIASRCQRFDFRRIPLQAVTGRLAQIAAAEGLRVEPAALDAIARTAGGALRDAISLLDQLASYGSEISLDQVQMVLGTTAGRAAAELVECLVDRDVARGLGLINRAVYDGADPRQFGGQVVDHLRGLLLIRSGADTDLLNATAEQAQEMEALAARMTLERLVRAIRLFNEATTGLRRGLLAVPQLPLESAFVESILEPGAPPAGRPVGEVVPVPTAEQPQATPPGPPASKGEPAAALPAFGDQVAAEAVPQREEPQPAPSGPTASEGEQAAVPAGVGEEAAAAAYGQGMTLDHVRDAWQRVLAAVRTRNPTTYAALNTRCEAVEVNGNEVVVTFPFPVLRDKLSAPQRKMEIQEALTEVLGAACTVTLLLASQYEARPPAGQSPREAAPPEPGAGQDPDGAAMGHDALSRITRWAEERGGQASLVEP